MYVQLKSEILSKLDVSQIGQIWGVGADLELNLCTLVGASASVVWVQVSGEEK